MKVAYDYQGVTFGLKFTVEIELAKFIVSLGYSIVIDYRACQI